MIVVVATKNEVDLIPEWLEHEAKKIIITGVGGMNASMALAVEDRDQEVVNVGYCGSNILPVGTMVSPGSVQLYHPSVDYFEEEIDLNCQVGMDHAKCYTSSDFVTETEIKEPVIFDMELAHIASMGFKRVGAIKKVSDNLSVKEYEENSK